MDFILNETNSIANKFLAEIRDRKIQRDRMRFRYNLERIGEVLAYEISKTLTYKGVKIETPLGIANTALPADRVVLATIMRAGFPIHQGLLNYFDHAENAFISAYRREHKGGDFEINLEYVSCPDLTDCVLILSDAMLATGASMVITLDELLNNFGQPKKIHIATAVASSYGLSYVKRVHPRAKIWMGAQDEELTAKSYIVPGLGDAGDLSFGEKMQEKLF